MWFVSDCIKLHFKISSLSSTHRSSLLGKFGNTSGVEPLKNLSEGVNRIEYRQN